MLDGGFLSGFQGDPTLGDIGGRSSASASNTLHGGSGSIVIGSQKEWINYLILGGIVLGLAFLMKGKK